MATYISGSHRWCLHRSCSPCHIRTMACSNKKRIHCTLATKVSSFLPWLTLASTFNCHLELSKGRLPAIRSLRLKDSRTMAPLTPLSKTLSCLTKRKTFSKFPEVMRHSRYNDRNPSFPKLELAPSLPLSLLMIYPVVYSMDSKCSSCIC